MDKTLWISVRFNNFIIFNNVCGSHHVGVPHKVGFSILTCDIHLSLHCLVCLNNVLDGFYCVSCRI